MNHTPSHDIFVAGAADRGEWRERHRGGVDSRRMRSQWRRAKSMTARLHGAVRASRQRFSLIERPTQSSIAEYLRYTRALYGGRETPIFHVSLFRDRLPLAVVDRPPENDTAEPRAEIIQFPRTEQRRKSAYDLYVQASALDEDSTAFNKTEALYRRAIALDPNLAIAYTNLGNIRFRRGDELGALALYKQALQLDETQPEAHYNIGYVMLERGEFKTARSCFERALRYDPRFADAHFNLATTLEQLGEARKARPHWKRYLEFNPRGVWADDARQHLGKADR
jgi:tetratricopeptide (TPR) repeat protein